MQYSRIESASIRNVARTIALYRRKKDKNNEKINQIDEEYRKKADAKKKSLVDDNAKLDEEISMWQQPLLDRYGKTVDELMEIITSEEEPPLFTKNKQTGEMEVNPVAKQEPEEKVVDTDVEQVREVVREALDSKKSGQADVTIEIVKESVEESEAADEPAQELTEDDIDSFSEAEGDAEEWEAAEEENSEDAFHDPADDLEWPDINSIDQWENN